MKQTNCPRCGKDITIDETRYSEGQKLVVRCPFCGKVFATIIHNEKRGLTTIAKKNDCGFIAVIENVFHKKQNIRLRLGDNTIGHYINGVAVDCPIFTRDPSVDTIHCVINVSQATNGRKKFTLRDEHSNTGTFVENKLLNDREKRVISEGTLFTIGATSIILHEHCDNQI